MSGPSDLEGGSRQLAGRAREELAAWLRKRLDAAPAGTTWFLTCTFRNAATTLNGASHVWRQWWESLASQHLNSFAVYGIESQRRGTPHVHAIIYLSGCALTYRDLKESWYRLKAGGIARCYPYDPEKGALYYLGKYVISDDVLDWGISEGSMD